MVRKSRSVKQDGKGKKKETRKEGRKKMESVHTDPESLLLCCRWKIRSLSLAKVSECAFVLNQCVLSNVMLVR